MAEDQEFTLPPLEERPLVTFALFAYNQEKYIREAVEGAFAQTYEPLEIILSDDCSTDRTFEIMERLSTDYHGPHKIRINRNKKNIGLIEHVNKINSIAEGQLIVAAAGDDVSLPERVTEHVAVFLRDREGTHSIHSSVLKIDQTGSPLGLWKPPILEVSNTPDALALNYGAIIGAAHSWSRSVAQIFGPIAYRDTYEDLIIGFRSSLLKGIKYIDKPLVLYRHGIGISTNHLIDPKTTKEDIEIRIKWTVFTKSTLKQRQRDCLRVGRLDIAKKLRVQIVKLNIKYITLRFTLATINILNHFIKTKIA